MSLIPLGKVTYLPGTPGTTTARDPEGNVTGTWKNPGITDEMWADLGLLDRIYSVGEEPIAQLWMAKAATPPPTPWIPQIAPPVIAGLSGGVQTTSLRGQRTGVADVCSILAIVPGLGAWLAPGCRIMSGVDLAASVAGFFAMFRKKMFAVYFGRRLLGLMAQEGLDEFMKSTKRDIRSRIRIRRSG